MKRFLKKRWLGLPVGIITVVLLVCLLAGSALAAGAFNFLSFTTTVEVDEPLLVEFLVPKEHGGDGITWNPLGVEGSDSLDIQGSAGDVFTIYLRINNRANSPLTVNTEVTGNTGYLTIGGFPDGASGNVAASDGTDDLSKTEWASPVTITIAGNTPADEETPTNYSLKFVFTRE